ncbi:restriction endonuclease subunit S [Alteromonas sp. Cnat2-8]|uniref:restriction endonuclease subunit S n=1 Tax=Alteromonas sp. Cnat2-8 TaxID=2917728 RepID=UPI001EF55069|nr:restriction endonuclease subunit S [Alteromonas sp. Cnat2-8]MCG7655180.1 restriction endonuclease subunit S [Alteromonas sp. Cnat2-8]
MSEVNLPSEWITTELENIGDVVTGKTPSKNKPEYFGGDIPFIKPADVNDQGEIALTDEQITVLGAETVPLIPPGSIVVTCIGNLGRCAITTARSATNQQINSVLPSNKVDVKFLYYQLRTLKEWMLSESSATTVTIINKSKFSKAPIICPPIAEQKVIADKLDTLLAQVETTKARLERIPEILKTFRQTVLAAAVSGKLTEQWREKVNPTSAKELYETSIDAHKSLLGKKYKSPEEVDIRNLKKIPQNWIYGVASHLVNPGDEIVYGIVQPGKKLEKGIPYVRGTDIQNGKILVEQLLKTSPEIAKKYERASLKENDILLGIIRATKVAVVPKLLEGANITQGTARFRANSSVVGHEYLALYLESPDVQSWLHSNYRGIDMPGLNLKDVRRLPVALPSIKEQTEIVRRVDKLFAFAASIEQNANTAYERVNNLTKSILAKAFRGELTAKWREQNPQLISGKNSAEALLERIKVERKAQKPLKKSSARKKS